MQELQDCHMQALEYKSLRFHAAQIQILQAQTQTLFRTGVERSQNWGVVGKSPGIHCVEQGDGMVKISTAGMHLKPTATPTLPAQGR
ncbi:carbon starvation induced protein CsiD [Helicobacter heilmannii]|uniref:carbon starvation induced protein CsiD n=1 Tax=Helicobacter heilmannii TaxID=35817 RepID=UPI0022B08CA9|nr:carbon starvation induced protein CsiD [Helicobacter heilmannii]